jgi:hypothetical protein
LIQVGTGKALSAAESTDASPDRAALAPANEKDMAQHWKLLEVGAHYKLVNRKTGKVLDVNQSSAEEGAAIILWFNKNRSDDNQLWRWDGQGPDRRLLAKRSGLVLDIDDDGKAVQRRADENSKQRWKVLEVKK